MLSIKLYMQRNHPCLWRFLGRLRHPTAPLPLGLWLLNVIVQRVFRVNSDVPWMVHYTSCVTIPAKISIGKGVASSFARSGGCYIQGGNGIIFGNWVVFAPGVKIISANHDLTQLKRWVPAEPIQIGDDCWIGANAIILPGVKG